MSMSFGRLVRARVRPWCVLPSAGVWAFMRLRVTLGVITYMQLQGGRGRAAESQRAGCGGYCCALL